MRRHRSPRTFARSAALAVLACAGCRSTPNPGPTPGATPGPEARRDFPIGSFEVEEEVVVPLAPPEAYDAFADDLGKWWDHTFSPSPTAFYLEARPGGGFYEVFDDSGDGVLHARVTWAQRGERLVFRGPLGLHGLAIDMVHTITFAPVEGRPGETRVHATVHAMGELHEGHAEAVAGVWHHFLVERYGAWARGELEAQP